MGPWSPGCHFLCWNLKAAGTSAAGSGGGKPPEVWCVWKPEPAGTFQWGEAENKQQKWMTRQMVLKVTRKSEERRHVSVYSQAPKTEPLGTLAFPLMKAIRWL